MAQTTEIFPTMRKVYKKLFRSKTLNYFAHYWLDIFVDCWSKARGFYFPTKFNWEWKWEMLSRRFEIETVALFKKIIKPGMNIIDIGAHVGYYTTYFSKLVGPEGVVYAFEPDSNNFELLKLNSRKYKNVKLYNLAVADQTGAIDFYKVKENTGCHSIVPTDNSVKISVPAVTLDRFIAENNLTRIDIIKIDIEGGESRAFIGMRNLFLSSKDLSIVTEFNPEAIKTAGLEPEVFLKNIEGLNFQIYQILPGGETQPFKSSNLSTLKYYNTGFINLMIKK